MGLQVLGFDEEEERATVVEAEVDVIVLLKLEQDLVVWVVLCKFVLPACRFGKDERWVAGQFSWLGHGGRAIGIAYLVLMEILRSRCIEDFIEVRVPFADMSSVGIHISEEIIEVSKDTDGAFSERELAYESHGIILTIRRIWYVIGQLCEAPEVVKHSCS